MRALLLPVVMVGCVSTYDDPWPMRAAIPPQVITRADLGLADTADVGIGDAWISLHDYGIGDVSYPIVGVPGDGLMIESVFDRLRDSSHAQLQTETYLTPDTGSAEEHPDTQYATLFVDVEIVPRLRPLASGDLATGMATLRLYIEVKVPHTCGAPPHTVGGDATGCLSATCPSQQPIVQRDDGTYQVGPLRLAIDVLDQMCQVAS